MTVDKNTRPTKLVWLDLEMTGLDPINDVILEVFAQVTDFEFQTLATYQARVAADREVVAQQMQKNPWWNDFPKNRDDFLSNLDKGKPLAEVQKELIGLVQTNFSNEMPILAGNSIHTDRQFIKHWLPDFDAHLHYRMLDVSSWKIIMHGKYGVTYDKKEVHRAQDDIAESIGELRQYLDWFAQNH